MLQLLWLLQQLLLSELALQRAAYVRWLSQLIVSPHTVPEASDSGNGHDWVGAGSFGTLFSSPGSEGCSNGVTTLTVSGCIIKVNKKPWLAICTVTFAFKHVLQLQASHYITLEYQVRARTLSSYSFTGALSSQSGQQYLQGQDFAIRCGASLWQLLWQSQLLHKSWCCTCFLLAIGTLIWKKEPIRKFKSKVSLASEPYCDRSCKPQASHTDCSTRSRLSTAALMEG